METYLELTKVITQDVHLHEHASSWPSPVTQFVLSLQNAMKIPRWLKSNSFLYTDERALGLLDQLRASEDAFDINLWDTTDSDDDSNIQDRLHYLFNAALVDCARIRKVVEIEEVTQSPCPKESFLAILVQDAVVLAHNELYLLEDVPVILPRSSSGVSVSLPGLIERTFHVPLIATVCVSMPIEMKIQDQSDSGPSKPLKFRHYPTVEEYLRTPTTSEESEEETEEPEIFPWLQAYFIPHPLLDMSSPVCHVPVLCMAEEEQLPMVMSSLLYQRRVWHIEEPLIGITFSKYETTIRLFVGWLENVSDSVLPRVHVGEIQTQVKLDLSSPSVALVISRFLCSLDSHISSIRNTMRSSAGLVMRETESQSSLAWRIDSDEQEDESAPVLENNTTRDRINRWVESQFSEDMPPRKRADDAKSSSSKFSQQHLLSAPRSIVSEVSKDGSGTIPTLSLPKDASFMSCSKFAETTEYTDDRIFSWMFGRGVAPQSVPNQPDFCEKYIEMTGFIWPEEWKTEDDLPNVDAALRPLLKELVANVNTLMTGGSEFVQRISKDQFPINLRILERSFSAIFQASLRSREKNENSKFQNETSWRHDHDRLLQDFFVHLVEPDGARIPIEDPLTRPTLEVMLRMPKSDALRKDFLDGFARSRGNLLVERPTKLMDWVVKRGADEEKAIEDFKHQSYVLDQYSTWRKEIGATTERKKIDELIRQPVTGRCDAFGRLLVKLPPRIRCHVPLVMRNTVKEKKSTLSKPSVRQGEDKQAEEQSSVPSRVMEKSPVPNKGEGKRYNIMSSSFGPPSDRDETVNALTSEIQHLRLHEDEDPTHLELPVLTVEYKRASVNQAATGTNQVRMYLTASVKFLEALGITNFAVYGVQADGSRLAIPAAIIEDDSFVYLFERLVQEVDISTPMGAFHYATILCRLAENHARDLRERFEAVKNGVGETDDWTMQNQHNTLKVRSLELEKTLGIEKEAEE